MVFKIYPKIVFSSTWEKKFLDGFTQALGKSIYTAFENETITLLEVTQEKKLHYNIFNFFKKEKTIPTDVGEKYLKNEVFKKPVLGGGNMISDKNTLLPVLEQSTKDQEALARAFFACQEKNKIKHSKKKTEPENLVVDLEYLVVDGVKDGTYVTSFAKNQETPSPSIPEYIPLCNDTWSIHKEKIRCKIQDILSGNASYETIIFLGTYYQDLRKRRKWRSLINQEPFPSATEYYYTETIETQKKTFFKKEKVTYKNHYYPLLNKDLKVTVTAQGASHDQIIPLQTHSFIYLNLISINQIFYVVIFLINNHEIVGDQKTFSWEKEKESAYKKSAAWTRDLWLSVSQP